MSDKAKLDDLAERYLDLWQDQMSALAGDPTFREALERLISVTDAAGPGNPAAVWAAWPAMLAGLVPPTSPRRPTEGDGGQDGDFNAARAAAAAPGAPAAAAASGRGGPDLDDFARRLAELEKRVAELESDARGRKKARSRSREGRA